MWYFFLNNVYKISIIGQLWLVGNTQPPGIYFKITFFFTNLCFKSVKCIYIFSSDIVCFVKDNFPATEIWLKCNNPAQYTSLAFLPNNIQPTPTSFPIAQHCRPNTQHGPTFSGISIVEWVVVDTTSPLHVHFICDGN